MSMKYHTTMLENVLFSIANSGFVVIDPKKEADTKTQHPEKLRLTREDERQTVQGHKGNNSI